MKTTLRSFLIASVAILFASLVGCASATQGSIRPEKNQVCEPSFTDGDKAYTWHYAAVERPFGACATSLVLTESNLPQRCPPQYYAPPCYIPQPGPCAQPTPPSPPQQYIPQPCPQPPCEVPTNTHIANSNNQGCSGVGIAAFNGAVGDTILGGCSMGAAALIRPSRTNVNVTGGGASAESGSSSVSGAYSGSYSNSNSNANNRVGGR